jgi:hypothetical protein
LQALVVIVGIGAIAAAAYDLIAMRTGLTVFGAAFAASVAGSVWFMRSYRCPECGQRLLPPRGWWHRFPGAPILMRCERCDVDWDVGLRGSQD